jgi:uncharacterized protein (DUF58 family)
MVRTYDEELSGRVGVVLDAGHTGQEDRLDPAVRAAGSLLVAALQAGHHAEWIALGGGEPARLTPFADERELLDALARLPLSPGCLRADRLAHALGSLSRRSALHLVLTAWNEDAAQAVDRLASQRRSVTVYLPEGVAGSADPAVPVVRFRAHGLA